MKDAEATLKIVTDGSLSTSFGNRAEKLLRSKRWWAFSMWGSVAVLIIILFLLYLDLGKSITFDALMVFRLSIVTPTVFLIIFSSAQYSKERDLLERYEFKSAVAQSLQSYTKLLRDEFGAGKKKDELLGFIISSINTVYREPYEIKRRNSQSFQLSSPFAKAEAANTQEDES